MPANKLMRLCTPARPVSCFRTDGFAVTLELLHHTKALPWRMMLLSSIYLLWHLLCRDASGGWIMHVFALCVYQLRKVQRCLSCLSCTRASRRHLRLGHKECLRMSFGSGSAASKGLSYKPVVSGTWACNCAKCSHSA